MVAVTRAMPERIGPYRVDGLLGRGASGVVYRGRDEALDRSVAIKLLTDLDPEARGRFENEAKAAARIVHPNVVQVFGVGVHEDAAYMTQELVDGQPLSTILSAGRTIGAAAAIEIAMQVAEGLAAAQAVGVLHRDVKPHNLLVTDGGLVKIADFGLAKILDAPSSYTASGTTLGTPHYMSPEQGQGKALDARSDQYALGATLYHLLAGAPPFDADTAVATIFQHTSEALPPLETRAPECPRAVVDIVERMLAKDPADRFASFEALLEALSAVSLGDADLAELVADVDRATTPHPAPRRSFEPLAIGAIAVVAVAVIATATQQPTAPPRSRATPLPSNAGPALPIVQATRARPVVSAARLRDPFEGRTSRAGVVGGGLRRDARDSQETGRRRGAAAQVGGEERASTVGVSGEGDVVSTRRRRSVRGYLRDLRRGGPRAIAAAAALGDSSDQRATMPLVAALERDDAAVSAAAAEALGRLGDIRALEPLERAARSASSDEVRAAAKQAYRRLWHVEE